MPTKPLDPAFRTVLMSWFNMDSVDMNNKEDLFSTASVAAGDLVRRYQQKNMSLEPMISDLEASLASWNPDFTSQIMNATSVDWLADEEYENAIKDILRIMLRDLKSAALSGPTP